MKLHNTFNVCRLQLVTNKNRRSKVEFIKRSVLITVLVFIKREIFKFFKVLGSFSLLSGLRKFLIVLELLKTTPNKLKTICNSKDLIQKIINLKNCCKDKHFKSLFLLTDFLFQLFCLKHYRFVGFKCMAIIKVL